MASSASRPSPDGSTSRAASPSPWPTAASTTTASATTKRRNCGAAAVRRRAGRARPVRHRRASDDGGADERDPGRLDAERGADEERDQQCREGGDDEPGERVEPDRTHRGVGRRRSVVAVAPHRGADDHRRRRQGGEGHAHREATEGETRRREHEQVGEVRHRQQARRRVRELRGREQRRIRAASAGPAPAARPPA